MSEERTLRVETERGLRGRKDEWLPGDRRTRTHIAAHETDSFRNYFYKYFIYVDILVLEVYPNPTIKNSQTNVTFVFF